MEGKDRLLLVTHVLIRQGPNGPQIDDQTAAGIEQWCRHFDEVTYYGIAHDGTDSAGSSLAWVDTTDGLIGARARLRTLPSAYRLGRMTKHYRQVRATLRSAVAQHRHLCFTIGGMIGDWPALAAVESIRQKRDYAAWIDRVEPSILRNKMIGASLPRRAAAAVALPVMETYTRHLLRNSKVALLQGRDTFDHYAACAPDPHCTYDTHTHVGDRIAPAALAGKQARILSGAALNIVYVGRAAAMKGPSDWLETLERLHRAQIPFRATWIGDGPDLSAMQDRIARSGLAVVVDLPGFVGDRIALLRAMRESDLLLCCHKTAESARCLIEALVSGCPIVGYGTAYACGLIEERGGAVFAPQDDIAALAERIADLHRDRPALARLVAEAAASGELYNEDIVYAHRARLMRRA